MCLACQDYFNLQQLMEEASSSRDAARTSAVVSALVQHIMLSWREHFARAVAMKFNCFFLMPFVDDFPFYLRQVFTVSRGLFVCLLCVICMCLF